MLGGFLIDAHDFGTTLIITAGELEDMYEEGGVFYLCFELINFLSVIQYISLVPYIALVKYFREGKE